MNRIARAVRGVRPALLALWLVLMLLAGCGQGGADASPNGPSTDLGPAPEFSHPDLTGKVVQLSELRGRTVIIDFWATWCPPCVFQPAELNAFWERHQQDGQYAVLGIEVGGASAEEIREWARENDAVAQYPILTGADEDLARRFGALGFPALVIVNPAGEIHAVHVGLTTARELEEQVASVARAPASAPTGDAG